MDTSGISVEQTSVIVVSLLALFAAAVFQPQRIQSIISCWLAVLLLAFALVLPTLNLVAFEVDAPAREIVETVRILTAVNRMLLAAGLIATAFALLPRPTLVSTFAIAQQKRTNVEQESSQRRPLVKNACLSCGQPIPAEASKCPNCGWSWEGINKE